MNTISKAKKARRRTPHVTPAAARARARAAAPSGIRAHAKRAVREKLAFAALSLFFERGFGEIAVNEIVRRSGVSARTFFRYFRAKEDVVIDVLDMTNARWVEIIRDLPAGLSPYEILVASIPGWIAEVGPLFLKIMALAAESPPLFAAVMSRRPYWEEHIAAQLIAYPGDTRMTHEEARIWAMLAMGVLQLAWHLGQERKSDADLSTTACRLLRTMSELPGLKIL
jgi:AcrR family transcriptional regulator